MIGLVLSLLAVALIVWGVFTLIAHAIILGVILIIAGCIVLSYSGYSQLRP